MVSSTARMKQAEHCGALSGAHVEPHRGVEGGLLGDQEVGQLVGEGLGVRLGGEVAVLDAPSVDGVDDPSDHLANGGLPLGRPQGAPEVLLGDDVGGVLGPGLGELHVALLERVPALLVVGDDRVADLPLDLVEWVRTSFREVPLERQPGLLS